jgi:hypothetical protein
LFIHESKVKYYLDEVTLSIIITIILIVILNVSSSVRESGRVVLEVIEVEFVCKNIIAVSTIYDFFALFALLESSQCFILEDVKFEVVPCVLLLFD